MQTLEKMPQAKIEAFYLEFPWLKKYCYPSNVDRVYVKRIDTSLLAQYPESEIVVKEFNDVVGADFFGPIYRTYKAEVRLCASAVILNDSGDELLRFGWKNKITPAVPAQIKKYFFGLISKKIPAVPEKNQPRNFGNERFEEAIARLSKIEGKEKCGVYIISIFREHRSVTIYKTPKGYDLVSWVKSCLDREVESLKAECAMIDASAL